MGSVCGGRFCLQSTAQEWGRLCIHIIFQCIAAAHDINHDDVIVEFQLGWTGFGRSRELDHIAKKLRTCGVQLAPWRKCIVRRGRLTSILIPCQTMKLSISHARACWSAYIPQVFAKFNTLSRVQQTRQWSENKPDL